VREPRSRTWSVRAARLDIISYDHDRYDEQDNKLSRYDEREVNKLGEFDKYGIWTNSDRVRPMRRNWLDWAYCMCVTIRLHSGFAALLFSVLVMNASWRSSAM